MADGLGHIYTVTDKDRGTELRCKGHPDWRADADWTVMDDAFRRAADHVKNFHPDKTKR